MGSWRRNGGCAGYGGRELVDIHATLKIQHPQGAKARSIYRHPSKSVERRGRKARLIGDVVKMHYFG